MRSDKDPFLNETPKLFMFSPENRQSSKLVQLRPTYRE